jgi:alpha-glucoside transport system permease protein
LAAFAIFQFLLVWNDLLIALLFLGEGERQVVTGAALITMAVPVLVFVTLQRSFVRGLTAGRSAGEPARRSR